MQNFITNKKAAVEFRDTRVYRGADINFDRFLLKASTKINGRQSNNRTSVNKRRREQENDLFKDESVKKTYTEMYGYLKRKMGSSLRCKQRMYKYSKYCRLKQLQNTFRISLVISKETSQYQINLNVILLDNKKFKVIPQLTCLLETLVFFFFEGR